jgi:7,8-dihydropterin-6-yl-methyl-4-(beta-D-ribofuranosyl)aminobenzene 5'-phosphate synthase
VWRFGFWAKRRKAEDTWKLDRPGLLENVGEVRRLSILPLVEWDNDQKHLVGEVGLSYLIKADNHNILFDVGGNPRNRHPSPLVHNMTELDVNMADVDAIVISHLHHDHVGGKRQARRRRFRLSRKDFNLTGKTAYVPSPIRHRNASIQMTQKPRVIFPGVVTTGALPRAMWMEGIVWEQSLAIRVKDKGIVLIVGSGHPQVHQLITLVQDLFDQPLYGLVGGLHFPVTGSRTRFRTQKWWRTGKPPWRRIRPKEVERALLELSIARPSLVAVSGHDSCDWALQCFRNAFGGRYRNLAVGHEIIV